MEAEDYTILVADDTESIRKLIKLRLAKEGYKVLEATNGEETLQFFEEYSPHLILLDIMMPKMFGWDVLLKIKERSPETKVVVMTAVYKKSSYRRKTIHDYGADEYLTKPFEMSDLISLVNRLRSET